MSTEKKTLTVNCPSCQKQVEWEAQAKYRPFCSERCQQVDLGAWSTESYRIPAEPSEEWSGDNQEISSDQSNYTLQ